MSSNSRKSGGNLLGNSTPNETFEVLYLGGRTDAVVEQSIWSCPRPLPRVDAMMIQRRQSLWYPHLLTQFRSILGERSRIRNRGDGRSEPCNGLPKMFHVP